MRRSILAVLPLTLGMMFSATSYAAADPGIRHDDGSSAEVTPFGRDPDPQFQRDWNLPGQFDRSRRCVAEHSGRHWRWDERRRDSHWDYVRSDGRRFHIWWDDTYCAPRSRSRDVQRDPRRTAYYDNGGDRRGTVEPRDGGRVRDYGNLDRDRGRSRDDNRDRTRDTDRSRDTLTLESTREQIRERR